MHAWMLTHAHARRTPHAARRTPHAARRTPHARTHAHTHAHAHACIHMHAYRGGATRGASGEEARDEGGSPAAAACYCLAVGGKSDIVELYALDESGLAAGGAADGGSSATSLRLTRLAEVSPASYVASVALDRRGELLATGSESHVVHLWSVRRALLYRMRLEARDVLHASMPPPLPTVKPEVEFQCASTIASLCLSSRGNRLVVGTVEQTEVYDITVHLHELDKLRFLQAWLVRQKEVASRAKHGGIKRTSKSSLRQLVRSIRMLQMSRAFLGASASPRRLHSSSTSPASLREGPPSAAQAAPPKLAPPPVSETAAAADAPATLPPQLPADDGATAPANRPPSANGPAAPARSSSELSFIKTLSPKRRSAVSLAKRPGSAVRAGSSRQLKGVRLPPASDADPIRERRKGMRTGSMAGSVAGSVAGRSDGDEMEEKYGDPRAAAQDVAYGTQSMPTHTCEPLLCLDLAIEAGYADVCADGDVVAIAGSHHVTVFDVGACSTLVQLPSDSRILAVAVASDGQSVAVGNLDREIDYYHIYEGYAEPGSHPWPLAPEAQPARSPLGFPSLWRGLCSGCACSL